MKKLTLEYVSQLTRGDIMAFDVAKHVGYYSLGDYGVEYFPNTEKAPKKYGPDYAQHKAFRQWLIDVLIRNSIKVVVAEDVIFGHFVDFRKLCEFRGILFEVCQTLDIPLITFKPSDIKKHGAGKGNATKEEMMAAVERRYHIDVEGSHDLADAIHIFMYFIHRYNL